MMKCLALLMLLLAPGLAHAAPETATAQVFHADPLNRTTGQARFITYALRDTTGTRVLIAAGAKPYRTDIQHGDRVLLTPTAGKGKGWAIEPLMAHAPGTSVVGGTHRAVFVIVDSSNTPNAARSPAAVRPLADAVTAFYRANSYGILNLQIDVIGPYKVAAPSGRCEYGSMASQAEAMATAAKVDLSAYQHKLFGLPPDTCGWAGLGTVGGSPSRAWVIGWYPDVVVHESGHNLGLWHSHAIFCGTLYDGVIGPIGPGKCAAVDYGDTVDVMGSGNGPAGGYQLNVAQKERLGWITPKVVTSGTYALTPYETTPSALSVPRAGTPDRFTVAYRLDAGYGKPAGLVLHWQAANDADGIYLLKLDPSKSFSNPALLAGQTPWTDPVSGIAFAIADASPAGANVTIGGAPPPPPPPPPPTCPPDCGPPPLVTDASTTFQLVSLTTAQTLSVSAPPVACVRETGGRSQVRIVRGTVVLGKANVPNPVKDKTGKVVPFTIRCLVDATTAKLYLDGALKLTVAK